MALRNILTDEDPTLYKVSRPVKDFNERLHILLDDMRQTLVQANGAGLAAPQVGVLRRAVLVDNGEQILELINPEILEQSGEQYGLEGCAGKIRLCAPTELCKGAGAGPVWELV